MKFSRVYVFLLLLSLCSLVGSIHAAGGERLTIELTATLLHQLTNRFPKGMSLPMLLQAQGILIIPQANRAGLKQQGGPSQGVFLTRLPNGGWSNPLFIRYTGPQVVHEQTGKMADLVVLFNNQHAVKQLLKKKQTLGVDLLLDAGEEQKAVQEFWNNNIIAFWINAGDKFPSLRGATVVIDPDANKDYYRLRNWTPEAVLVGDPLPETFELSSNLTRISNQAFTSFKAIQP